MTNERIQFLSVEHLPLILNKQELAWLLGCAEHSVSILITEGLVTPLGRPNTNGKKYFQTQEILEKRENRKWLNAVTEAIRP